jgi:hypothetical protein
MLPKHRSVPKRYWTVLGRALIIAPKSAYPPPEVPDCFPTRAPISKFRILSHRIESQLLASRSSQSRFWTPTRPLQS